MSITMDQLEALSKQAFILDYLANGLFPCDSDIVRMIRGKKKEWAFTDKFEYRMLLANTNTGGTLNSQVFNPSVSLRKPGDLEYGVFHATYGSVSDGFDVDMMVNLETKQQKVNFHTDYQTRMSSLRYNVASLFKNFAIGGRFGVVHQIRASIAAPVTNTSKNPVPNVHTPVIGTPFTIKVPKNVFASNFKKGKYLIKTKEPAPWGQTDVSELYLVIENQPGLLTLLPVGTTVSDWEDGQFLEVAQNREVVGMNPDVFSNWNNGGITVAAGPYAGVYDQFTGTGTYTSGADAVTGAMEGLADLFPWYSDPANMDARLGIDLPFRGQSSREVYTVEQAGQFLVQQPGQHIIDVIMEGVFNTKQTVPWGDIAIWMNPVTRQELGYEEGNNVQVIRDNFISGPIVYQRGVKSVDYQIGTQVVREVVEDFNMPTDVILIGPKSDISYNCWDNSMFEIDKYIRETWSKTEPPPLESIELPMELVTSLDMSQRITYGAPTLQDGRLASFSYGNNIRHPKNVVPLALHEMGALFTEHPYCYTVVKLREPICELSN